MKDKNNLDVKLGDYLKGEESWQTYQLRKRGGELVLHSGACYIKATQEKIKTLEKVYAVNNEAVLGMGADLFNSSLET